MEQQQLLYSTYNGKDYNVAHGIAKTTIIQSDGKNQIFHMRLLRPPHYKWDSKDYVITYGLEKDYYITRMGQQRVLSSTYDGQDFSIIHGLAKTTVFHVE